MLRAAKGRRVHLLFSLWTWFVPTGRLFTVCSPFVHGFLFCSRFVPTRPFLVLFTLTIRCSRFVPGRACLTLFMVCSSRRPLPTLAVRPKYTFPFYLAILYSILCRGCVMMLAFCAIIFRDAALLLRANVIMLRAVDGLLSGNVIKFRRPPFADLSRCGSEAGDGCADLSRCGEQEALAATL
jgi:hypothetical protein